MKTYIVYVKGKEKGYIKAPNLNKAEKKAREKYKKENPLDVSVAYTEL